MGADAARMVGGNGMSDLIDRQEAIDAVIDACKKIPTIAIMAKYALIDLKPAQPERNRGFWWAIEKGEKGYSAGNFHCSVCGEPNVSYISKPNFCPNCGADMRGEQNDKQGSNQLFKSSKKDSIR
jgi:hypothetical protein